MRLVSLDLETHQVEDGILAPRVVCGSTARLAGGVAVGELLDRARALSLARALLADGDVVVAGANVAYDFACLMVEDPSIAPLVFRAYDEGRVHDVQVAQALHAIAEGNLYLDPRTNEPIVNRETGKRGRYSLDTVVEFVLGRVDAKERDRWRRRYAVLEDWPVEEWPADARQYPVDDAVNTLEVAVAQLHGGGAGCTPGPHRNMTEQPLHAYAALAMHLGATWGLRTDGARVAALRAATEELHRAYVERFRAMGFIRPDGSRDTAAVKRAVARAYGDGSPCPAGCVDGKVLSEKSGNPVNCGRCSGTGLDTRACPKTPGGGVKADQGVLAESGDDDLAAFGENEHVKVLETYLPFLESGVHRPITVRPNVLLGSGRASYDGLIQILPREGEVRGCIAARPGYFFCSVDYAAIELCTLAQVCLWLFGQSVMADTINASGKPGALHAAFGAELLGISTEEMVRRLEAKDPVAKRTRQAAKAGNYTFGGGGGSAAFVLAKRKRAEGTTTGPDGRVYEGLRFCLLLTDAERCGDVKVTEWNGRPCPPMCRACLGIVEEHLRPTWFRKWPEVKRYHRWVSQRADTTGEFPTLGTEFVRGRCGFTDGANHGFQGVAAVGAKRALVAVTREAYTDPASPLWGTRVPSFLHDELFAEMPEGLAHLAGPRMAEITVREMRTIVEDVCVEAEPALMRYMDKSAEPVFKDGRLIPWEDR